MSDSGAARPDRVLRYGESPQHVADVRFPPGEHPCPVVLVLHGGYWRAQYDREYLEPMCAELTARGYLTVNIEYRRVGQPGGGWPGTAEDVRTAVRALPGKLDRADPARVVLAGHSAGGHLALLAAGEGATGVLGLAAVSDLAETARRRLDGGAAQEFMGGEPNDASYGRYVEADPMRRGPVPVPTVLVHGEADDRVPHEFSVHYATAAAAKLRTVPGADHFDVCTPGTVAWPLVLDELAELAG